MEEQISYRGRTISRDDLRFIRDLIARHPQASRWRLSKLLCEAWDWRHANGTLRDVYCRGLMLWLHRDGHIRLPTRKQQPRKHPGRRRQPATDMVVDRTPIEGSPNTLPPIKFRQIRHSAEEPLFNGLVESYHYLGYSQPVGEHLKYLVYAGIRSAPV